MGAANEGNADIELLAAPSSTICCGAGGGGLESFAKVTINAKPHARSAHIFQQFG